MQAPPRMREPMRAQRWLADWLQYLAADVAGYSRLMSEDETGTLAALQAHRSRSDRPRQSPNTAAASSS